jgi:hypothetical protein
VGDLGAGLRGAGFLDLTDVACKDDDVLHFSLQLDVPRDHSLRQDPAEDRRF